MEYKIMTNNETETIALGKKIGSLLKPGFNIFLKGDLGSGKTTFAKGVGQALGVKKIINSPTFTIVKEYMGLYPFYHLDLYRLEGLHDDFIFEDYFDNNNICLIEWPEKLTEILPKEYLLIQIEKIEDTKRIFYLFPTGDKYERLVRELICIN